MAPSDAVAPPPARFAPLIASVGPEQVDLLIRSDLPLRSMEKDVVKMLVTEMEAAADTAARCPPSLLSVPPSGGGVREAQLI